ALLAVAIVLAFGFDLVVGPSGLTLDESLRALLFDSADGQASLIVREVRLPIALMALLVGAALSLAGAEMQTVLNNPLASPFTLGVSSAATFGAALALIAQLSLPGIPPAWIVPANAFVF